MLIWNVVPAAGVGLVPLYVVAFASSMDETDKW